MSKQGIIAQSGGLNFGDYIASDKIKVNDFDHMGDVYNLRAHNLVTRLEKNGELLFEAVPGVSVCNFTFGENTCAFEVENPTGAQITLGLAPEATYDLSIGGNMQEIATNRSGKLSFGIDIGGKKIKVALKKL